MRKMELRKVSSLKPAAGAELNQPVVDMIAESLRLEGLREPLVITEAGHIIHGAHRWAAAKQAGIDKVECVIEHQAASLQIHRGKVIAENLARTHLGPVESNKLRLELADQRDAYGSSLADAIRKEATPEQKIETPTKTNASEFRDARPETARHAGGRPKTEHAARRDAVAKNTGTTPEALKKAEQRAKKKEAKAETEKASPPELVDATGKAIPDGLRERWVTQQGLHDKLASLARAAVTEIGKFRNADDTYPWGLQYLHRAARDFGGAVRVTRPVAICEWCDGDGECQSCGGMGFVAKGHQTEEQKASAS